MPTHEDRVIRSDAIADARLLLSCRKAMRRYYPNGIVTPDSTAIEKAEALPEDTRAQRRYRKKLIKSLVNEKSKYTRSVKILLDARRMIIEKENFTHLDEIREQYKEAKNRLDEKLEVQRIEHEKLEEKRKADLERRRQEHLAKKNKKRGDRND